MITSLSKKKGKRKEKREKGKGKEGKRKKRERKRKNFCVYRATCEVTLGEKINWKMGGGGTKKWFSKLIYTPEATCSLSNST